MHLKSDNIETMIDNETHEIIKELFDSLLQKVQKCLEEKIRRSEFAFNSIDLLYYRIHKIVLTRIRSNIDSSKWLKNKSTTINPKNNYRKCCQYVITVSIIYQNIKKNKRNNIKK